MNNEIKEKWIEALLSGNYKQGEGCLRVGDNFCCLGVLKDIVNPNSWRNFLNHEQEYLLDDDILNLLDISEEEEKKYFRNILPNMNDGAGGTGGEEYQKHSFEEIAAYIKENL